MRYPPLLLDASPLLTYLAVCFFRDDKTPNAKRLAVLRELRGDDKEPFDRGKEERLVLIFDHSSLATTNHVVVETLKFRDHSELKSMETPLREFSLTLLAKKVQDFACPINRLVEDPTIRDLAVRLNVADAGLVAIARDHRFLLLTDDSRLFQAMPADNSFEIQIFEHFLDSQF